MASPEDRNILTNNLTPDEEEIILHEASKLHSEMALHYIKWSLLVGFVLGVLFMWVVK